MDRKRMAGVVMLGWLAVIGFDFFFHAGLLAAIYQRTEPFLLPLDIAFRRIPFAYVGFLFFTAFTVWLVDRLGIVRYLDGFRLGLIVGVVNSAGFILGLWSIATVPLDLALGWALGQMIEIGIAGAVAGYAARGSLRPLVWRVIAFVVVMLIAGVILQNIIV